VWERENELRFGRVLFQREVLHRRRNADVATCTRETIWVKLAAMPPFRVSLRVWAVISVMLCVTILIILPPLTFNEAWGFVAGHSTARSLQRTTGWAEQRFPKVYIPISDTNTTETEFWTSIDQVPNNGFVTVQSSDGSTRDWGVSMWHQLHCLSMLRAMLNGNTHSGPHGGHSHHPRKRDEVSDAFPQLHPDTHWKHCLDYLAQVGKNPPSAPSQLPLSSTDR
jgi:hypothetical protein